MIRSACLFLLAALPLAAAELQLRIEPRWNNDALAVPSAEVATAAGQHVRVTRLAALLSDFQLLKPDGSLVRLENQFGFIDAGSGRLTVALANVPAGDYRGLQVRVGVPDAVNHADPGLWPPGHALNPQTNGLHWSWSGGYVFLALEGYWRGSGGGDAAGFSYHLAKEPQRMTVRFLAPFQVESATRVDLAFNVAALFANRRLAGDDGSDTTHSADHDALAGALARSAERAFFWLGAAATGRSVAASHRPVAAAGAGTPYAFTVPAGFPQPALPADNPLTEEGVELGRRLFFDRRLSGNGGQSCASCHDPRAAFSDRVALSRGTDGERGRRNAMPLFNLAWHPAYAWDGTKRTIREQALAAMTNPVEMHARVADVVAELGADPRVRADFAAAFGTDGITAERLGRALEQFLLVQVSHRSKFDAALAGTVSLSEEEKRGFALFMTESDPARGRRGADCFHCHGGALFSDFAARSNGLDLVAADAGAQNATGRADDRGRFKTPSLRNVALTAPYMHDGRFRTLEEVVAHYDHGVQRAENLDPNLAKHPKAGLGLSADEQRALVAFLKTLTDHEFSRSALPPEEAFAGLE
ncbi:MbnP family protein [Oleiharenicola sp. Vm1]|uniref:MbnP family protein n=1 Tax=Oleiharenicola sp. Vm1 TaxID=3398393 RepID=UPI0039F49E86